MNRNCLFFLFLSTAFIFALKAQDGRVILHQDQRIDSLIELYKKANAKSGYYTIQVGFGSYDKAQQLHDKVQLDFPDWYSKIVFDSPTYRVHVGRFRTKLEAERNFLKVRRKYPESLLLKP